MAKEVEMKPLEIKLLNQKIVQIMVQFGILSHF